MSTLMKQNSWKVSPELLDEMLQLRRHLHKYPELSGGEGKTAEAIKAQLDKRRINYRDGLAGHGIVAEIPGNKSGPAIALRADMDALPIHEETGLSFASVHKNVMHACGHDGHSSMLLGAAALLQEEKASLEYPVRFIWQPAEEKATGAQELIKAGVLDNVGLIFSGHIDPRYPSGSLVITEGPVNASSDQFVISIRGQQGHGARPHEATDAIVIGSLLVTAIQTIISREIDPAEASVISVGEFNAGSAPNVIAGEAQLTGTVRAQETTVRKKLELALERVCKAVANLHGSSIEFRLYPRTPPLINSPEMTELARAAALKVVDNDKIVPLLQANMGGEDFAYYLEKVPGAYIRFGARIDGGDYSPAHSNRFDFDEAALEVGALWFASVAFLGAQYLAQQS